MQFSDFQTNHTNQQSFHFIEDYSYSSDISSELAKPHQYPDNQQLFDTHSNENTKQHLKQHLKHHFKEHFNNHYNHYNHYNHNNRDNRNNNDDNNNSDNDHRLTTFAPLNNLFENGGEAIRDSDNDDNNYNIDKNNGKKYKNVKNVKNVKNDRLAKTVFQQFESFRNNTSFFAFIDKWNIEIKKEYNSSMKYRFLSFYQYQAIMYFSGYRLNYNFDQDAQNSLIPRGVLMYFGMGTGKTITFIGAALRSLINRIDLYNQQSKIYVILNKALQLKTVQEIRKYIDLLNKNQLSLDLRVQQGSQIDIDDILQRFVFITYNDSKNFQTNILKEFSSLKRLDNKIVVFDECQNLFRSINEESARGSSLYEQLIKLTNSQLLFASGTPISNNVEELAPCFQLLTSNTKLFVKSNFQDIFISQQSLHTAKNTIRNKEIFIKRIVGLVIYVQVDVQEIQEDVQQTPNNTRQYPQLLPLQIINLQIPDEILPLYQQEKKKEAKGGFMSNTRMLSNAIVQTIKGVRQITSAKFQSIKQHIEANPNKLHIFFSNFVENGCLLFHEYCLNTQSNQTFKWIDFNQYQQLQNHQDQQITSFKEQKHTKTQFIKIANIHGNISPTIRESIINTFNQSQNNTGNLINVLVLSPASIEGINLHSVRFVHILEPQWSLSQFDQIVFRAVRKFSHQSLPPQDQTVQPLLYISYEHTPYTEQELHIKKHDFSTDQYIYYKSFKKYFIISQFQILLSIASINCIDYQSITLKQLYKTLNINQLDDINPCFSCQPNKLRLFDPSDIYKDLSNNNCIRNFKSIHTNTHQLKFNNINYTWFFDIYSQFGFRVHESRNIMKTPIDENTELFRLLYPLIQQQINDLAQPLPSITKTHYNTPNITQSTYSIHIIKNTPNTKNTSISIKQTLFNDPQTINLINNDTLSKLLPDSFTFDNQYIIAPLSSQTITQENDNISYSLITTNQQEPIQFYINQLQSLQFTYYEAIQLLRFKQNLYNTLQYLYLFKIKQLNVDLITDFQHYKQSKSHKQFLFNGRVIPFNQFYPLLLESYAKSLIIKFPLIIQPIINHLSTNQHIDLIHNSNNDLNIQMFKDAILYLINQQ